MKNSIRGLAFVLLILINQSCLQEKPTKLFTRLLNDKTGIAFSNLLKEDDPEFSILNYPYFYNGGGVAVGDINNDGLPDLVFTGNMVKNSIYLNKGNFTFEDITKKSTLGGKGGWCTGVTMVDINGDGWQDIYICRSGLPHEEDRRNLLYINRGDLTFKESAAEYGLDDPGYSTQASFFDYDNDGDLDVFLINQSDPKYSRGNLDFISSRKQNGDSTLTNKLYRNNNGHFTDVTKRVGISSSIFTYSLGLSTADINQDGWPDIYVGNDFEEADYMYINNRDGTFTDELAQRIDHTSLFSMGIDVADYNNDFLPDLVQMDMLPEGNYAQKMHLASDNYNRYTQQFQKGMFPQYMKNSLQKNNGDGTFSEIGQLAGISNTDWSWSPLVADFDNDGRKDLFITNGYLRDNTDMQFVVYAMDMSQHLQQGGKAPTVPEYIAHMPGINLPNYIFKNEGGDHFSNKVKEWGFDRATFSQGAAYGDLDNDGDLDLVINNTGETADVYRNNTNTLSKNNYLKIKLAGGTQNGNGFGAKIYMYAGKDQYYLEQIPVRGYQSSMDPVLTIGLGDHEQIDSIQVIWPGALTQWLKNVKAKQTIVLKIKEAKLVEKQSTKSNQLLKAITGLDFIHHEKEENDFAQQFLLPHSYSHGGPCLAKGDVNGDGLEDIFVGGAEGQGCAIFLQAKDRTFGKPQTKSFIEDTLFKTTDAVFFDADGDKDLDLYVVSGGYELPENSLLFQDRLYLNDGKGNFKKSNGKLESYLSNKSCVRPVDFDNDGDFDLFVGGGVVPAKFPMAASSKIYFNDGSGNFKSVKPANAQLGMVHDALWIDLDHDGKKDLIVASEWMPLKAYRAQGTLFADVSKQWFPFAPSGWWNCIAFGDFDHDGDDDLVVGNEGINSQIKAEAHHPMQLFYTDIDNNGSVDPLITYYNGDENFPLAFRDDLIGQVPFLKKKFNDYPSYAKARIADILAPDQLAKTPVLTANFMNTIYLENTGKTFVKRDLPLEAQFAPVYSIAVVDLNKDGNLDLVMAGGDTKNRIYLGRDDANHGQVFLGDGKGNFSYLNQKKSGLNVRGDVRSILTDSDRLFFGVNNSSIKGYQFK